MRRMLLLCLMIVIVAIPVLAQHNDSAARALERERMNRLGDSLHKAQLARDSAFQELLNKSQQAIDNYKRNEEMQKILQATQEVIDRQQKERRAKLRTILQTLAFFGGFAAIVLISRRIRKPK